MNIKHLIYIIFSSFFLYSCSKQKDKNIELQVYNDIIKELVDVDYGLIPVPPPPGNKRDSIIYINKLNEYKKRMDTVQKILFVKDSLISIKSRDYRLLKKALKSKHVDFIDVLNKNEDLNKKSAKYLDVSGIKLNGVKLIPRSKIARDSIKIDVFDSNDVILGQIVISRILFDNDYKKGILIYNFFCRKKCGFGQLVLVEHINGKWIILDRIEDWIM